MMNFSEKYLKNATRIVSGGVLFALMSLIACSKSDDGAPVDSQIVAQVDKAKLTLPDVLKTLPGGLSAEDSARYVKVYVNNWIESQLIANVASEDVDMEEINRLADEYRRRLIMQEYLREMYQRHAKAIPNDSIEAYYKEHKGDFVLERPMVKGTYLKVADDAANLKTLKRLYSSDKLADADRLEKEVLSSAIHYDYFRDRWVDWEQIETRIPAEEIGSKALAKKHKFETSAGGFTYLLYITDVLPAGSPMPLEAARSQIVNRLINRDRKDYEHTLTRDLYDRALESGRLKVNMPE